MKQIIIIEAGINFFTNASLNSLCAYLLNRNAAAVSCDLVDIIIDTCITCLFISLCTTPLSAAAAKRYIRSGALQKHMAGKRSILPHFPRKSLALALCFAFIVMLPLAPLLAVCFSISGISVLSVAGFVLYKGVLGGIIGSCVCIAVLKRFLYE